MSSLVDFVSLSFSIPDGNYGVEYEGSATDPYFLPLGLELNPIKNHNCRGFLYISNTPQYPGGLFLNVSPSTVAAGRPILVVARVTDELGNPIPQELVKVFYQLTELASLYTNLAGEAFYEFVPEVSGTVTVSWKDKTASCPVSVIDLSGQPAYLRLDINPMAAKSDQDILLTVYLYDRLWRPASGVVVLQYVDDSDQPISVNLNVHEKAVYVYRAGSVKRSVLFKVSYGDIMTWNTLVQLGA